MQQVKKILMSDYKFIIFLIGVHIIYFSSNKKNRLNNFLRGLIKGRRSAINQRNFRADIQSRKINSPISVVP